MAQKIINGSPGLFTAANSEIAPPGSYAVAQGVVIRKPGITQKQRPFRQYAYDGDSTWTDPVAGTKLQPGGLAYFYNRLYVTNISGELWRENLTLTVGNGVFTDTGFIATTDLRSMEANSSWFPLTLGGNSGLLKVDTTSGSPAPYYAGCPRALDLILSEVASGSLLTSGQSVAYRAVIRLTDANGYQVRGAPSGRALWTASASTKDVSVKCLLPKWVYNAANATSFRIEFYRSKVALTGVTPDDEMFLVGDYGITSTDVSNKYVTFTDNTPDSVTFNGPALYTNPSRGGIANAYDPPPLAQDCAYFKGFMLLGNTTQKHRARIQMLNGPEAWSITGIVANSPAAGQSTYTFAAGVDLTGFNSTFKLAVVNSTGASNDGTWAIAAYTSGAFVDGIDVTNRKIVVTNAGTNQAGTAGTGLSGKITLAGTTYFPIYGTESVANRYYTVPSTGSQSAIVVAATSSLIRIINQQTASTVVAYSDSSDTDAPGKMLLEEKDIGGSAFTMKAEGTTTAGYQNSFSNRWAPSIPAAGVLTSVNDARQNRIHYSAYGTEGFPIANQTDLGSALSPILRIIALRNAVLIFKRDGLYLLTADGVNLSTRVVDPTQQLVDSHLVVAVQNKAVAITSRGAWVFTETGSQYIGQPVENIFLKALAPYRLATPGNSRLLNQPRMSASDQDGLVFIYLDPVLYQSATEASCLIYGVNSGAWTQTWAAPSNSGSAVPDGITGQARFAEFAFTQVNGLRVGLRATTTSTLFDIYAEDQYATASTTSNLAPGEYATGTLGNLAACEPVTGHKYLINISAVNAGAKTITCTSLGGPAIAVNTLIREAETGSIYKVTAVNGSTYTLAVFLGTDDFVFSTGRAFKYAQQPIQIDWNRFTDGDESQSKMFQEVLITLDQLSTVTASSCSVLTYTETAPASSATSVASAVVTTLQRIGVERVSMLARGIQARLTHSNPLEYLFIRGISYVWEPVEDDRTNY